MESIYHEQQEGQLCAQHCLNALLQESLYTAVDLASLAHDLDEEEGRHLGGSSAASQNMDDTGFFSVQVLSRALQVWGLELVPFNSTEPRSVRAQAYPTKENAYICNFEQHWLTIRRLGNQWFNLNSLLAYPELLSDSYLSEFLGQLGREGYSIFVVAGEGSLPHCVADEILLHTPAVQTDPPPLLDQAFGAKKPKRSNQSEEGNDDNLGSTDPDLQKALELSRQSLIADARDRERSSYLEKSNMMGTSQFSQQSGAASSQDADLDLALKLSQGSGPSSQDADLDLALKLSQSSGPSSQDADLDLALKLSQASFQQENKKNLSPSHGFRKSQTVQNTPVKTTFSPPVPKKEPTSNPVTTGAAGNDQSPDGQRLGGQSHGSNNSDSDVRELRLKRLAFLDKQAQAQKDKEEKK